MRQPIQAMAANLAWTSAGTVWANYLIEGLPYGLRPTKDKKIVRQLHQALIRALPGECLLLGVRSTLDPAVIVSQMLTDVDLDRCPDWLEECEATLESLDQLGPGQRIYWLAVPLGADRVWDRVVVPARAALSGLKDQLGLPRTQIPAEEISHRLLQAARIQESIPAPFKAEATTVAQRAWLHRHMLRRGLLEDMDLPSAGELAAEEALLPRSGAVLTEPVLDEGGQSDLVDASAAGHDQANSRASATGRAIGHAGTLLGELAGRVSPMRRRYLKVTDTSEVEGPVSSYQTLMVVSSVPENGSVFPGAEILGRLDESGVPGDWAMRLTTRSSASVAATNQRALQRLNEQFVQLDGEVTHSLSQLDRIGRDLGEYAQILANDSLEVETQPTMVFAVGGATPEESRQQAASLAGFMADTGYKVTSPLGYQEELWWAMQPGVAATAVVREFAQITTSRSLSTTIPFASVRLGDGHGTLLGINISNGPLLAENVPCGPAQVVLHDLYSASDRDASGSLAIAGEPGGGKALALDTPIPTPTGWSTMGELALGDVVFDETGAQVTVLGVSSVMRDHDCYEVEFSDGSTIVADAEHLWTTIPRRVRSHAAKRNFKPRNTGGAEPFDLQQVTQSLTGPGWFTRGLTVTTEELRDTLVRPGSGANHAIPVAGPLRLPGVDLPVDPYLLGAWLGDGSSRDCRIYSDDPQVLSNIEQAGFVVRKLQSAFAYAVGLPESRPAEVKRTCLGCGEEIEVTNSARLFCNRRCARIVSANKAIVREIRCQLCGERLPRTSCGSRCRRCERNASLRDRLRRLGVLGNKHIPGIYLRSAEAQRRDLLAGLLDTDGTVSPGGSVQYATTVYQLAVDVAELVVSLGYRASVREGIARVEGRDCGAVWTVSFSTADDVFRLDRKRTAARERTRRHVPARNRFRYVVAVRPVPSVPVRCIKVSSPSRLYLAGRAMIPTHNTATLKKLSSDIIDRDGQLIIIDRTEKGEWADWADSMTKAVVVDTASPQLSLDPLRIFGPRLGSQIMQSFLTPLINVSPTSERGVLLSDVLDPIYMVDHDITSAGALVAHLQQGCTLHGAGDLARLLNVFARRELGQVVFSNNVPALELSSPAVVIRTHKLLLPDRSEIEHAHLFEQLGLEKLFGRALNALVATIAKHVCLADTSQLSGLVVSEAHGITISSEGEDSLATLVRDGRKHRAVVLMDSHDPIADFGSPTLRGLIPGRLLMRQRDKTLAQRGLEWLDLDPADESLVKLIREDTAPLGSDGKTVPVHRRGEGLLRDLNGNLGRIKVLLPARADRRDAITKGGNAAQRVA